MEIEKFEVSEWDLANEFNPDRRRHRQTKEEATYGIWAEHDSDDERPSFGGKRYLAGDYEGNEMYRYCCLSDILNSYERDPYTE